MGFWKNFFKKKNTKPIVEILKELSVGDLIFLEFKTPEDIGIVSGQQLILTRLNPKEAQQRKINGSVVRSWKDPGTKAMLLEISTYCSPDMPGIQRKMTFLENEIKIIRKLSADNGR